MKKRKCEKRKVSVFFLAVVIAVMMLSGTAWAQGEENISDTVENAEDIAENEDGAAGVSDTEILPDVETNREESGETRLPSYLEPTNKVDKLELTKNEPVTLSEVTVEALSFTPQTGDDSQLMIWVGVMIAAAIIAVVVIVIWKKRR